MRSGGIVVSDVAVVHGEVTVAADEQNVCASPVNGNGIGARECYRSKTIVGENQWCAARGVGRECIGHLLTNGIEVAAGVRREREPPEGDVVIIGIKDFGKRIGLANLQNELAGLQVRAAGIGEEDASEIDSSGQICGGVIYANIDEVITVRRDETG